MANTNFATDGILSAKIGDVSTDSKVGLGTRTSGRNGSEFLYVQANGAVTGSGYVVSIDGAGQASLLGTSNDALGNRAGVALSAMADNDYGWVQIFGPSNVRVAASATANTRLNTTAIPGQLDDDGTTGAFSMSGVVLTTANGGAAGNAAAMLNYPTVGIVI